MKKGFASFLVLAVTMLLAMPTHAQELQRISKAQMKTFQTGRVDKQETRKAKAAEMKTAKTTVEGTASPITTDIGQPLKLRQTNGSHGSKHAVKAGEDDIITTPEAGVTKYYTRTGTGMGYSNGVYTEAQSGTVEVVETANGTVYIKDIISHFIQGTWVKGTKSGNTITIAGGQPVAYNSTLKATLSVNWGTYNSNTTYATRGTGDITFAIDGDKISLSGSSQSHIIGIFWDDDDSWQGFGDYNTVWTLNESYIPPSKELVELPAGAVAEDWYAVGTGSETVPASVKVAFSGNDIYVCGIFKNFPNSWIKGTINGTKVTFESPQYLGANGTIDVWALGSNDDGIKDSFTFTYDAEAQSLSFDEGQQIIASAATDRVIALAYINALNIYAPSEIVTPPVTLNLTEEGALRNFTVIDANQDGRTWTWEEDFGIYYMYHRTNVADDYLILPVKLEANKNYHVVVTAYTANDDLVEKFEVKVGKSEAIGSLNITAIPEQAFASMADVDFDGTFDTDEAGTYYIAIHATSDPDKWRLHLRKLLIEPGVEGNAPSAVSDLSVIPLDGALGAAIAFTAPTKALDGTDLAANGITKIEILRDGKVINTFDHPAPGAMLTYTDQASDLTIGTHKYQVVTYGTNSLGTKSDVVSVFMTAVIEVPYFADFKQSYTMEAFHVIDHNNDNSTWNWNSVAHAFYDYNNTNQGDDYLVTSPIHLEGGKIYKVTVNALAYDPEFPERFEVVAGKADNAEALNISIIAPTVLTNKTYEEFEGTFTADEDANYYVAIHAISDPNQWRLQVSSLSVEHGPEVTAPDAPAIEVVPDNKGNLSATVNVTAPSKSIDGYDLPAENLTKIAILRDGTTIRNITPAPGEQISVTDKPTAGNHTYQALPYDANGELGMKSEKVTVYVGKDQLAAIQNFRVTGTTASTITFTWDEVASVNGGFIDTESVVYTIYGLVVKNNEQGTHLEIDRKFTTVTGAASTTATINFPVDEGKQNYQYFGISAKDNNNQESDPTAVNTFIVVGAPEELPVEEGFAGTTLHYAWNTNGIALIGSISSDGDGVAMALFSSTPNETIHLQLDKVNLSTAVNPTLLFDVKSDVINTVRVIGSAEGAATTTLATESVNEEYKTVKVPLTGIESGRYATVGLEADFVKSSYISPYYSMFGDSLIVDNIRIVDLQQYNLMADVKAKKSVRAGGKAPITATVTNKGEVAANGYTVIIKAGDKELLNKTVNESLAPFQASEYATELQTSIFDEAGEVAVTATVVFDSDQNPADNTAETIISIKEPMAAQPQNLTGAQAGNDIVLSWNAPEDDYGMTEDVEDYDAEDNGGLGVDIHMGTIGEWTVYDGNEGKAGYGFNGLATKIGDPGSWLVFNPGNYVLSSGTLANRYPAHSGDQYFISSCVAEPEDAIEATDNWLISPELPGIAQTIRFFVCEVDDQYGAEQYQVLASTTDNAIESFSVVKTKSVATTKWKEETVDLPAGTRYFAIRHVSQDVFAMLLDDISYLSIGNDVASYNIYCEEERIAVVTGEETTYTDAAEKYAYGDHVFAVSAVHENGKESKPVTVTVTVADPAGIGQVVADGKPVDIYSIDGKLVRGQTRDFSGLRGIYVINGKAILLK